MEFMDFIDYNFLHPTSFLIYHFLISLLIGFVAKKYLDRPFLLWFIISLLVPFLSIIILIIIGYEGNYCPECLKKIRKHYKICPYCNFDIDKYYAMNNLNREHRLSKREK